MIGKDLLHYHIQARLGAGGMGVVYQARDTKLGRNVALKILPEMFARDPERVARFKREAKLLASVNHANIAALYGLEQADGRHFLLMELVQGDTLAERIARGPIPVEETLGIARQIIEGLEAAHERNVIHRDLKPANVKITPEGKVKVLDFGLAKVAEVATAQADATDSPTLSPVATDAGVILGTPGYMSPEQAKGRLVDQRSDIFSFGCIVYEMLSGRRAFDGETATEVIASVLKQEPDLSFIPPDIHPRLVELVCRCLAKDTRQRWHTAADIRVEIETIFADSRGLKSPVALETEPRSSWKRMIPILVITALVMAITASVVWNLRPSLPVSIARFPFVLPEGQILTRTGRHGITISPDGDKIVYVANTQLYVRTMSETEPHPIEGTALDIDTPFFSPDGRWIGFYAVPQGKLKKIATNGGPALPICDIENPFGATWTSDDHILVGQGTKGILRVSANGGLPQTIIAAKQGEVMQNPQLLPDGDHVLFTVTTSTGPERWNRAQIVVQSMKSGERKLLIEGGADARYAPSGHLIYATGASLVGARFDATRVAVSGGPVSILDGVMRGSVPEVNTGAAHFSFANNGTMVHVLATDAGTGNRTLVMVERSGVRKPLPVPPGFYYNPRISPGGNQVAVEGANINIWIHDLSGVASMRRLTFEGSNTFPVWTRDGKRIVFRSNKEEDEGLFWQRSDGSGAAERLTKPEPGVAHYPNSVSPDGKTLLFRVARNNDGGDIWILGLDGSHSAKPLIATSGSTQDAARFSPDGKWIAYQSGESGRLEVYIQPFPPTGAKYQITATGARFPMWSPDGRQIFYIEIEDSQGAYGRIVSVDVRAQQNFTIANPTKLPIERLPLYAGFHPYDITPDGKQFLATFYIADVGTAQIPRQQMRITLNWFDELKHRIH